MISCLSKWFEPRSISSSCSVIVRVSVVLKRTVGDSQDIHKLELLQNWSDIWKGTTHQQIWLMKCFHNALQETAFILWNRVAIFNFTQSERAFYSKKVCSMDNIYYFLLLMFLDSNGFDRKGKHFQAWIFGCGSTPFAIVHVEAMWRSEDLAMFVYATVSCEKSHVIVIKVFYYVTFFKPPTWKSRPIGWVSIFHRLAIPIHIS